MLTPRDGEDAGDGLTSETATVLNTAPEAPEVAITPSGPAEGEDDLLCEILTDSYDLDSDDISYSFTWTVDGAAYSGATTTSETGDTVPAEDIAGLESWHCLAEATDGDLAAPPVDASVRVAMAARFRGPRCVDRRRSREGRRPYP